jgi:hypothetical protein
MKKCYYFLTWEEQKDVMIDLGGQCIVLLNDLQFETRKDIGIDDCVRDWQRQISTPSDPILAKLCELAGVKMYGGYAVLDKIRLHCSPNYNEWNKYDRFSGDLIEFDSREWGCRCNQKFEHCKGCLRLCNKEFEKDWGYNSDWYTVETVCNIFQEYSKFLRKEENKWEEVKKVLDL